uniref:Uncharacterized protein n=1 Tax=Anguilla anguilla TaxID=7936 RepID=A0A0E9XP76_ANGAN
MCIGSKVSSWTDWISRVGMSIHRNSASHHAIICLQKNVFVNDYCHG